MIAAAALVSLHCYILHIAIHCYTLLYIIHFYTLLYNIHCYTLHIIHDCIASNLPSMVDSATLSRLLPKLRAAVVVCCNCDTEPPEVDVKFEVGLRFEVWSGV